MHPPTRPAVSRETDQAREYRGNLSADAVSQEPRSGVQVPPHSPVGPPASNEVAFETFVGGAGI
jgi:hypothetical protein